MKKRRHKKKNTLVSNIIFILLSLVSLSFIYPLIYMFTTSMKTKMEYYKNPISLLPESLNFSNFQNVFTRINLPVTFTNSFVIAFVSVVLITAIGAIASYAFAKIQFRFKYTLFLIILATMFIPAQVTMIPVYLMFSKTGLVNNILSVILVYLAGGLPGAILLFTASFRAIPSSLCESAKIDGASHLRIALTLVLPLGKAAIAISIITGFISYWNDLFTPLILLNEEHVKTIMVALAGLTSKSLSVPTLKMAGMFMSIIPALVLYLVFQKSIVKGLTVGAIK